MSFPQKAKSNKVDPEDLDLSKAILVTVLTPDCDQIEVEQGLEELAGLAASLEIEVCGRVTQRRKNFSPRLLMGPGKIDEIAAQARHMGVGLLLFDKALSPPQFRNLEKETCLKVLDRTGLILEIFHRQAKTNAARTQVEIARLEYMLPRMVGAWTHFGRQSGGGATNRGMGEKQIEVDRRRAREKISRLKRKLEQIHKDRENQRKSRARELKVALVGYSNSGKSTLMHELTEAEVIIEDKLFASLDAKVQTLDPRANPRLLLIDTVGFIRKLPHSLIESFRSTLDETRSADLLVHVVDASDEQYREHMETTISTLELIGAGDIPVLLVLNKLDQIDDPVFAKVLARSYPKAVVMSAKDDDDVGALKGRIQEFFTRELRSHKVSVPMSDGESLARVYQSAMVLSNIENSESQTLELEIQGTGPALARLRKLENISWAEEGNAE
jgi:GTP-binding protein HflX